MANYEVYMLRIWKEGQSNQSKRLTLENTKTGSRVGFTEWDKLVAFLDKKTNQSSERERRF